MGTMRIKEMPKQCKHALPSCLCQEGLAIPRLDGPVWNGYTNVVKASTSNLSKILLGLRFSVSINTMNVTRSDIQ